jgi:histidinol-phosphate aminotransferase
VGDGKAAFQSLMKRGVIIRDMNAYGLPSWIRVSVGTMDQNRRFVEELVEHLGLQGRLSA